MKFLFGFFVLVFFTASPALEAMATPVETGIRGHGIVVVTQGHTSLNVQVEGEGLIKVRLLRATDRAEVAADTRMGSGMVRFSKTTIPTDEYIVQVWIAGKLVDEVEVSVE